MRVDGDRDEGGWGWGWDCGWGLECGWGFGGSCFFSSSDSSFFICEVTKGVIFVSFSGEFLHVCMHQCDSIVHQMLASFIIYVLLNAILSFANQSNSFLGCSSSNSSFYTVCVLCLCNFLLMFVCVFFYPFYIIHLYVLFLLFHFLFFFFYVCICLCCCCV